MKTERLLIVFIVAVIFSLAGVRDLSYAEEPNQAEIWFKAIKELQSKVNDNDRYIELCETRIVEKKALLEKARMQNLPTGDLELEIARLQRELAIRVDSGKRWKSELEQVKGSIINTR